MYTFICMKDAIWFTVVYFEYVSHQSLLLDLSPRIPIHSNANEAYLDETFYYLFIFWESKGLWAFLRTFLYLYHKLTLQSNFIWIFMISGFQDIFKILTHRGSCSKRYIDDSNADDTHHELVMLIKIWISPIFIRIFLVWTRPHTLRITEGKQRGHIHDNKESHKLLYPCLNSFFFSLYTRSRQYNSFNKTYQHTHASNVIECFHGNTDVQLTAHKAFPCACIV